ncbi:hypothetical protein AAMO2058_000103100 [Amorphochlora amoebiformis]|mmetsp:Transcript_5735/g.8803  ORF Transcript_5735/g.8803 Transcript_5735/m.8803 type:complete len:255 (-) Transcript_5735:265-1029(-)
MSKQQKIPKSKKKSNRRTGGFSVLPLALGDDESVGNRCLYFKKHHSPNGQDWETIFVTNIPCDLDLKNVSSIFSPYGEVAGVEFLEYGASGVACSKPRCARVSFEQQGVYSKLLELTSKGVRAPFEPPNLACGMKRWLLDYKRERPDVSKLQIQVDRFMEAFDKRVREEKNNLGVKEVDEDGFELVKRKSRKLRGSTSQPGIRKKRLKKEPVVNFYKAQKRAQQQEKLALLRKKFEEDRAKIAEMRKGRKFKPY